MESAANLNTTRCFYRLCSQFSLWLVLALVGNVAIAGIPPGVTISSVDLSADEDGADTATVTITRSANSPSTLNVNLSVTGSADRNIDYSLPGLFSGAPLAVNIPRNETSVQLTLTPLADNIVEGQEDAIITIEPGTGYTVGATNSQTMTIEDDVTEVNLTLIDGAMAEAGQDPGSYRVTRTNAGNIAAAISVNIDITGSAIRNQDYSTTGVFGGAPLAVQIPANELERVFTLTPLTDNNVEGEEAVQITLQPDAAVYTVGADTTADFTLSDDVTEVNLTLIDGDMAEAGQDPGSYRVTRTSAGNPAAAILVNIDIGGSAIRNQDYSTSGVFGGAPLAVQIPANELESVFTLTPLNDNIVEGEETVQITLQPDAAVYTVGADTTADFTLSDDVTEVNLTLIDGDMAEAGQDPGSYRVTRTSAGNPAAAILVNIDIGGSAIRNQDYSTSGVFGGAPLAVQIPANELERVFTLTPLTDNLVEGEETVQITLQPDAAVYTVGADTTADFTLSDDVTEVNLTLVDGAMDEAGLDPGSFRVTRSNAGNIASAINVNIDIAGSAVRNLDYSTSNVFGGAPLAVQIPANELERVFVLTPIADAPDDEGDETIEVTLQSGSNYTVGPETTASLVIADLIDFLFSDSFEVLLGPQQKECNFQQLAGEQPGRYFDQGASILDLETDLVWSKCGLSAPYDWLAGRCDESVSNWHPAGAMAAFNAGLAGDNAGFSDWRAPVPAEQATLAQGCAGEAVR